MFEDIKRLNLPPLVPVPMIQALQDAFNWVETTEQIPGALISHLGLYYTGVKPAGIAHVSIGWPAAYSHEVRLVLDTEYYTHQRYLCACGRPLHPDRKEQFVFSEADIATVIHWVWLAGGEVKSWWNGEGVNTVGFSIHKRPSLGAMWLIRNYHEQVSKYHLGGTWYQEGRQLAVVPEFWS